MPTHDPEGNPTKLVAMKEIFAETFCEHGNRFHWRIETYEYKGKLINWITEHVCRSCLTKAGFVTNRDHFLG